MSKCNCCGKEVKGKKKGSCCECRKEIPFVSSDKHQKPFRRSK